MVAQGDADESGPPGASPTDLAILKYLSKKGYRKPEELQSVSGPIENVALEATAEQDAQTITSAAGSSVVSQGPPHPSASTGTVSLAAAYEMQFTKMTKWILSSLEIYRNELIALIFPILVHVFLDLHARGLSTEASSFLASHRRILQSLSILETGLMEEDLEKLQTTVKDAIHLREVPLAVAFRSHKYNVRLSLYAFELFVTFVNEHRLTIIRKIVNAHCNLIVTESSASTTASVSIAQGSSALASFVGLPQAEPGRRFVSPTLPKVWWGVAPPEESILRVHASMVPETAYSVVTPSDPDATIITKDVLDTENTDTAVLLARLRELSRRVIVGRNLLPSSICYTLHNSYGRITTIRFSRDGVLMATGSADSHIDIWCTGRGIPPGVPPCSVLATIRRSPELAHIDLDAAPSIAEIKAPVDECEGCEQPGRRHRISRRLIGHSGSITGLDFSFDRRLLLSSSIDGTIRLWSLDNFSALVVFRGHSGAVWDVSCAMIPAVNAPLRFASAGADKTARIWSSEWCSPLRLLVGHLGDVEGCCWHPNCLYLATFSSDQTIRLWDISLGMTVRLIPLTVLPYSLSFSPCGKYIACGSNSGNLVLIDIPSSQILSTSKSEGTESPISSLTWSVVDGKILVSGALNGSIALWEFTPSSASEEEEKQDETNPLTLLKTFYTKNTPVLQLDFSARNLLLVAGIYTAPSTSL